MEIYYLQCETSRFWSNSICLTKVIFDLKMTERNYATFEKMINCASKDTKFFNLFQLNKRNMKPKCN